MKQLHCALIFTIVVIFAVTPSPVDAGADKALEVCMQENGVTIEDVEVMYKTGKASQGVKCTMSCTLQALGVKKPDGSIVDSSGLAKALEIDHSAAGTYHANCLSRALLQTDICDRGFVLMNCAY